MENIKVFDSHLKLGQVITKEDIHNFKGNVILDAGTSTGKTTLILTTLSEYCAEHNKKILFVCNRTALKEEVENNIKKLNVDNVDVTLYQKIESDIKRGVEPHLEYDYIALDECHHFLEHYNKYTDLSYTYFMNHPSQKIFMSATNERLFSIFLKKKYVLPNQYYKINKSYDYITKLYFYFNKEYAHSIIEDKIKNTNDKIIYFTNDINDALKLYYKYQDNATFQCSKNTINSKALRVLIENEGRLHDETFEGQLLLATKSLDVGVNLKDKSIKTIILNMFDYNTLIQCLGRKRIVDETDTCEVYIRNYDRGKLNLFRNEKQVNEMELFLNDREKFNQTILINRGWSNPYIYFDKTINDFKLNALAYLALSSNEDDLDYMTKEIWYNKEGKEMYGWGYKIFILNKLGIGRFDNRVKDYEALQEEKIVMELVEYLDSIIGKRLYKNEQEELKRKFKEIGTHSTDMGFKLMNADMQEKGLPYVIENKTDWSRKVDGVKNTYYGKVYWIIGKITYTLDA